MVLYLNGNKIVNGFVIVDGGGIAPKIIYSESKICNCNIEVNVWEE
jgi:hypothetical protein